MISAGIVVLILWLGRCKDAKMNQVPYLLIRSSRPLLPIPVWSVLSMSCSVPSGKEARVSGTNVTLVRLENAFVNAMPCFAFLPTVHPSFLSNLISCLPVMAGNFVYLGNSNQLTNRLDVWLDEGSSTNGFGNSNIGFRFYVMEFYVMLLQESLTFSYILKSIEMEQYRFFYSFFSFRERTPKCSCAKFYTTGNPSSILFLKCKRQNYIAFMHGTSFFIFYETFLWLLLYRYTLYYYLSIGGCKFVVNLFHFAVTVLTIALYARSKISAIASPPPMRIILL